MTKEIKTTYGILKKRNFYLFCGFWILIAILEFTQDYISSVLNIEHFELFESLSYKLFWPLYIPFTMLLVYGFKSIKVNTRLLRYLLYGLNIAVTSVLHLIAFSIVLFGMSKIIHDKNTWRLSWLLTEKFSNYLYITLSIYFVLTIVYFWLKRRASVNSETDYAKTITVKKVEHLSLLMWKASNG